MSRTESSGRVGRVDRVSARLDARAARARGGVAAAGERVGRVDALARRHARLARARELGRSERVGRALEGVRAGRRRRTRAVHSSLLLLLHVPLRTPRGVRLALGLVGSRSRLFHLASLSSSRRGQR